MKRKRFCMAKDTIIQYWQATKWEKMFNNDTSNRWLLLKINKELLKVDLKKTNNPIKRSIEVNGKFSEGQTQMTERQFFKWCSISFVIRKVQIKTFEISSPSSQITTTNKTKDSFFSKGFRMAGGSANLFNHYEN